MKKQFHILVADDEKEILELVSSYLMKEGYLVSAAHDGCEVLKKMRGTTFDLIMLDILMPNQDGFKTCERIREMSNVPIIMLTAKSDERDRIHGMKIGADDYIVKPFSPKELLVRIEAMLRRANDFNIVPSTELDFDGIKVNLKARKLLIQDQMIDLTKKEYDLLVYLLKNEGQVFSRETLLEDVWGTDSLKGTLRTVDTHIKTIRYKLGDKGKQLKTVYGVGYMFEVQ
ncbi:MAG: response regulator transcription factor [Bacillaceae bacterium]|nr:response regulator transcription factor [Bacillaceae bacterium]